jgi:hypothetical protein
MNSANQCLVWLGWPCLSASEWAAWVQAIGSIAAIGIAIWIPIRIHRADQNRVDAEKRLRARSFALALLPAVETVAANVRHAAWRLKSEDAHFELEKVSESLAIPAELEGRILEVHEMGAAGEKLQDALALLPRLRLLLDEHDLYQRSGGVLFATDGEEVEIDEPATWDHLIQQVDESFQSAVGSMRKMFG